MNDGHGENTDMFSTLPQCVADQGRREWETRCMQREDVDAPPPQSFPAGTCDTSESEASCLDVADSPPARRRKLDKLVCGMGTDHMNHLRSIKRKVQRAAHNLHRRKKWTNSHFDDLIDDISAVLSWQTHQTRNSEGKFSKLDIH